MDPEELLSIAAQADFDAETAFAEEVWIFNGDGTVNIPERNSAASTVQIDGEEDGEEERDEYPECTASSCAISTAHHEEVNPVEQLDMHQGLTPVDTHPSSDDDRLSAFHADESSHVEDASFSTSPSPIAVVRSSHRMTHSNGFHPYQITRPITPRYRIPVKGPD